MFNVGSQDYLRKQKSSLRFRVIREYFQLLPFVSFEKFSRFKILSVRYDETSHRTMSIWASCGNPRIRYQWILEMISTFSALEISSEEGSGQNFTGGGRNFLQFFEIISAVRFLTRNTNDTPIHHVVHVQLANSEAIAALLAPLRWCSGIFLQSRCTDAASNWICAEYRWCWPSTFHCLHQFNSNLRMKRIPVGVFAVKFSSNVSPQA